MFKSSPTKLAVAMLLAFGVGSASAELMRVGPTSQVHGYPQWYQDKTGLALEFCSLTNQAELDGGHCLLLPGDTTVPEVFPSTFADEHFFWAADANMATANGGRALLVLGLEAAFAADVQPGGQIMFSRIRVRLDDVPATGTYRFVHPYGEEVIEAAAGDRIFFTDDTGINCPPGQFDCALQSRLGPFLLPSVEPGGAELPPVIGPAPGKLYIADPGRSGPVTGSTLPPFVDAQGQTRNHNIFRVEGPAGSNLGGPGIDYVETTNFTLMGRVYQGAIPGRVAVDRASYSRTADATPQIGLNVFATGEPTTQSRLPAGPLPPSVQPALSMLDAPCVETDVAGETVLSAPLGATETLMANVGTKYWAQATPAAVPFNGICIKDNNARDVNGNTVTAFVKGAVGDKVNVDSAVYDPASAQLQVTVASLDALAPPTLTLDGYPDVSVVGSGTIVVTPLAAPPATARVLSTAKGSNAAQVDVVAGIAPPTDPGTPGPVANADAAVAVEDGGPVSIMLFDNDENAAGGLVNLIALPGKGSVELGAEGMVSYTPNPNANGTDQFSYTVTVGGKTSNVALVGINIAPENDAPVAVDDANVTTPTGVAIDIPVLDNDSDIDGDALVIQSAGPAASGAQLTVVGNAIRYQPAPGFTGPEVFSYTIADPSGATATASATVTVVSAETLTTTTAEFRTGGRQLRLAGTSSILEAHSITLTMTGGTGACNGQQVGVATSDVTGAWQLRLNNVRAELDPRNGNCTNITAVSDRGGSDLVTAIAIRR